MSARRRMRERQFENLPEPTAPAERRDEIGPQLDAELSRLPEKYRVPILLCDLQGKTQKEAARQLGWREGTLSGRLFRGRELLARRLQRHGVATGV